MLRIETNPGTSTARLIWGDAHVADLMETDGGWWLTWRSPRTMTTWGPSPSAFALLERARDQLLQDGHDAATGAEVVRDAISALGSRS